MDRQTLLQMFTAAMRHQLQHGAAEHGAETWQFLTPRDCAEQLARIMCKIRHENTHPHDALTHLVNLANYAAFAWALLQDLPGRDNILANGLPEPPLSLGEIQRRMAAFQVGNKLAGGPELMALGVMEELGEFAHALLKHRQGIRGYDDPARFAADARDAIGDCLIYLTQLTDALGWDLQEIIEETVTHVTKRDWVAHPEDADQVAAAAESLGAAE